MIWLRLSVDFPWQGIEFTKIAPAPELNAHREQTCSTLIGILVAAIERHP
jgi:hypothetical protein